MEHSQLTRGQPLVVMDAGDHVATVLRDLSSGELVDYSIDGRAAKLHVLDAVPFGHKIALCDLPAGAEVRKYGAVIGRTTAPVAAGSHVHVHNLAGVRGRGDLAGAPGRGASANAPQG
jgi:altronate dehydratase small subunit